MVLDLIPGKKVFVQRDVRETAGLTTIPTIGDWTNANHTHSSTATAGQLNHTTCFSAGAGTNTHAQIDTHISNTTNPHSVTTTQINAVSTSGDQSVSGVKTFSSFPITPSSAPTTDYQVANKAYVDAAKANFFSGGIGLTTIGTGADKYASIQGISTVAATWESNFVMIPRNGTLRNFRTWVTANGTNFTINFYVVKGEDNTNLTTQYTAGQTGGKLDSTHTVEVSAGELIQVHYVAGAGAGTADTIGWSVELV